MRINYFKFSIAIAILFSFTLTTFPIEKEHIKRKNNIASSSTVPNSAPNYNYDKIQKEKLGRGLVAIRKNRSDIALSWRYLSTDPLNTAFNIYRNGIKIATVPPSTGTFYCDHYENQINTIYKVKPILKGKETNRTEGTYTLPANSPIGYINIPLVRPADGITPDKKEYSYTPNDASIGDVDGDGEYEIILKWEPTNSHDNAHDGYTGNVFFDCYKLSGKHLWRIDMGRNVRAGAHYTQFLVYDFDSDGRAEIIMKTSDGTVDGEGNVIGNSNADYRYPGDDIEKSDEMQYTSKSGKNSLYKKKIKHNQGRILSGNEYLTIFNGLTGKAMQTINYVPPRGNIAAWGDTRANRSDRFLAAVAYLDGIHPSAVMCRGYYTRTVLVAFDWDGKQLKQRWIFDSNTPGCETYAGQGNHNLRVGDVDGDGCDEIIYGSCTIDNNGKGLYSTELGHGDAIQMTQFSPTLKGLQVWACHENKKDGSTFRDAATGKILFQIKNNTDVGRCMAADIDPYNPGVEMWSSRSGGLRSIEGKVLNPDIHTFSTNMAVWWDGDLLRELLDKNTISKYDWTTKYCKPIAIFEDCTSNNGTKATPCLQGDIIGDWREEILLRTKDNSALHLYVSSIPTKYRFHTFLEDPVYRVSIANQNIAYNQPTQPGFYFGPDLKGYFRGYYLTSNEYKK